MRENEWIELHYIRKNLFRKPNRFIKKKSIQIKIEYGYSRVFYRIVKA